MSLWRPRAALFIACIRASSSAEKVRTTAAMAARFVRVLSSLAASTRSRRVMGRSCLARKNSRPLIVQPWTTRRLRATWQASHVSPVFIITGNEAAAIRAAFERNGELSAAIELRRRFPGISDNAHARACVRSIAGWSAPPAPSRPATRLRRKNRCKNQDA